MMYTVEQITQAIDSLENHDKERLLRSLATPIGPQGAMETPNAASDYILWYDGGDDETDPAFAIVNESNVGRHLGRTSRSAEMTDHEADYAALREGLCLLVAQLEQQGQDPQRCTVEVRGNSRLVHQQVQGLWRARDERTQALRQEVSALLGRFGGFRLIEMSTGQVADHLAA